MTADDALNDGITEKIKILATDDEKIKSFGELLTNDSSREILQLLFNEELSATQIAQKTDISLQLVKYHLIKLQDLGIVKISKIEKNSKSKDMKFYSATKFSIVIVPPKLSEKTKESKLLIRSFRHIYKVAGLGIATGVSGLFSLSALPQERQIPASDVVSNQEFLLSEQLDKSNQDVLPTGADTVIPEETLVESDTFAQSTQYADTGLSQEPSAAPATTADTAVFDYEPQMLLDTESSPETSSAPAAPATADIAAPKSDLQMKIDTESSPATPSESAVSDAAVHEDGLQMKIDTEPSPATPSEPAAHEDELQMKIDTEPSPTTPSEPAAPEDEPQMPPDTEPSPATPSAPDVEPQMPLDTDLSAVTDTIGSNLGTYSFSDLLVPLVIVTGILAGLTVYYLYKFFKKS